MRKIETDNLFFRSWTKSKSDALAAFEIWGNPNVLKYIPSEPYRNVEEAAAILVKMIDKHEKNNFYRWAVVAKDKNKIVGGFGFHVFEGRQGLEIVYHLAESYWGKGYATEAVGAGLQFVQKNKISDYIFAGVHPENIASQRVLAKFGFRYIGLDENDYLYELKIL